MRTFWMVWVGQLVSQVGTAMTGFAMTIWVYQETGSVTRLGFMLAAVSLPGIVLAPTAGVMVDRMNRRVVMLAADSVAGLGSLTLAMLFFSNSLIYWQILVVVAVSSAASSFQEPAYRAAIPTIVPTEHLGRANGLSELGPAVGTLIAPAIAGGLLLTIGLGAVLAVDFITFTVAAATLLIVRFPDVTEPASSSHSVYREFLQGFDYLKERRGLLGFLLIAAALNFVLTFANVLWVPVFLAFMNEAALGVTMSVIGAAMVVGSVVMGAWGGPKQRVRGMLGFMAIGGVGLIVAGLRPDPVIAVAGAVMLMGVVPIVNGTSQTLWQTKIAPAIQGRVFSTRRMVAQIATPIAFVSAGPLADNVFEPLLMPDGALADSLGQIWDTGTGRGSALAISCVGVAIIVIAAVAWMTPSIRNIERDIPDALPQLESLELA
ncbi:MAG TPA: MFS transporter [Acidimicrobiia bacterium]|nr:MFS transporter [Acidimicrobiia bacterium]